MVIYDRLVLSIRYFTGHVNSSNIVYLVSGTQ